jgi:hypothetical protein
MEALFIIFFFLIVFSRKIIKNFSRNLQICLKLVFKILKKKSINYYNFYIISMNLIYSTKLEKIYSKVISTDK